VSTPTNDATYARETTLAVGAILSAAFDLVWRNLIAILALTLPLYLLYAIFFGTAFLGVFRLQMTGADPAVVARFAGNWPLFALAELAQAVLWLVGCCATIRLVHLRANHMRESVLASALHGAERFLPALGVMLVLAVALVIGLLVIELGAALLTWAFQTVAIGIVGMIAGVVTLFYLLLPCLLALTVCVTERAGPIAAIGRSYSLCEGYRWPLLGLTLLVAIILGIVDAVLVLVVARGLMQVAFGGIVLFLVGLLVFPCANGWIIAVYTIVYDRLNIAHGGSPAGPAVATVFD